MIHTFVVLAYKESEFLEDCIKSVLNQSVKSKVVIATTTPNNYIKKIASKYELDVNVGKHTSIGGDFDFAVKCGNTDLVTVAHQDDVYEYRYAEKVIDNYRKYKNSIIIFTDYYEIRNKKKVYSNFNLKIKRILLANLYFKGISGFRFIKRNTLRFGNSICCPSVTFIKRMCPDSIFKCDLICNIDWYAWEKLSNMNGKFIFIKDKLMGHRIDDSTTTTDIINKGIRTKEDLFMFKKFWPSCIASLINKSYRNAEKSNKL